MRSRLILLILIDVLLAFAAFYSAAVVRFGYVEATITLYNARGLSVAGFFAVVSIFSSQLMDVYDVGKNVKKREILINVILGTSASFFILSIAYYLEPTVMMGRGVLILSIALFALYQFLWHCIFLVYHHHQQFLQRILILGTGPLAQQMGQLAMSGNSIFTLAGYAACTGNGDSRQNGDDSIVSVPSEAILGNSDDLMAVASEAHADLIVVALSERRGIFPLRDVLRCKLNGIEIMDAPTFYERVTGKLMLEHITPSWIIFSSGFRRTTFLTIFKRCSDIILSSLGLLLAAPVFPFIALMIKLDSPGPLFFRQVRVGCREKPFTLYKLRSMRQDAEAATGAVWAQQDDPRITRIGLFLRNTRLDEIPQLINVLKGDMSFIGPRPERPEFVEKLKIVIPYYSKRHFVKPGVTGWAQVKYPYGASVEDAVEKLRYDLYYIKDYSIFLDLLIFFETIKVVLFGRGVR
ncbi:MAG: exopolysaccharide biosynthesis polyprenyl glycosylphosphotransferase [Deltaproteobacteria bacterium]|nr:exopolysaccharide biosynthesis polyprenyl glycosylphosphotransferase [Deltaproteobacteria bacterium]